MVLLDADVAGSVESWLGSPQPPSGQRHERLEQCRAELDHVLPLLSDSAERPTGTLFGRLALRVGNGLDPLADLFR